MFIRKYLKSLPVFLIWGWLFVFFADSANLDDFISHVIVIHTDELIENNHDDDPTQDNNVSSDYLFSNLPANQSIYQSARIIYDIDSPSLAPDFQHINKDISENIVDKKVNTKSVSLFKLLYIRFHSLLI